ncbi:MAG TPA: metallophosphoesterase family protein, partial [Clostridiales bacterium]|nr:metallophosphoesterase family protein [Clostridiales bacterium]
TSLLKEKMLIAVRGNCDLASLLPYNETVELAGKRIYCSHGHWENVKFGTYGIREAARAKGADIALYGHTHKARIDYEDGLYLFNPGSVREGSYGVVDITKAGIVCVEMKIKYK